MKVRIYRHNESGSDDETEDRSENEASDTAITADTEAHTVHLNSKATRGAGYISVNETFTDQKEDMRDGGTSYTRKDGIESVLKEFTKKR